MADIRVDQLSIFPVKALGPIHLDASEVTVLGLSYDRRWMLVDENGKFYSQREAPDLGQCKVSFDGDAIVITKGADSIRLPRSLEAGAGRRKTVRIWADTVEAVEGPIEAARWFTDIVGRTCTPVYLADESARRVNPRFAPERTFTSFTDGFPILVSNTASLDDLNRRMPVPLPMSRFRPNIVVSGSTPFEEDAWGRVAIGDAEILGVKPCSRCVVTTIDTETLEQGKEPLKTLATFRKFGDHVLFAENFVVTKPGTIKVGDKVVVRTLRSPDEVARARF